MWIKTIALAAAITLGAAAAAQASEREPDGSPTGYRVGPMGQVFGGRPFAWAPRAYYGYAYAPNDFAYVPRRHHRIWRYAY